MHRLVSQNDASPLYLTTYAGEKSSLVHGIVSGLPSEFDQLAPERWWFSWSVLDSEGHITSGRLDCGLQSMLPEFSFSTFPHIYYTVVVSFGIPGSNLVTNRLVMFEPIAFPKAADFAQFSPVSDPTDPINFVATPDFIATPDPTNFIANPEQLGNVTVDLDEAWWIDRWRNLNDDGYDVCSVWDNAVESLNHQ